MEVIKISPRGYCYGVVDALQVVRQVAKDPTHPRPIYIIGQIVHNRHAIEELSSLRPWRFSSCKTRGAGTRLELYRCHLPRCSRHA